MASQPPPSESDTSDAESEQGPTDAMERFNALARGLLNAPRQSVIEAEKRFKQRKSDSE